MLRITEILDNIHPSAALLMTYIHDIHSDRKHDIYMSAYVPLERGEIITFNLNN